MLIQILKKMKIKNSTIIRIFSLFLISVVVGLVGRMLVNSWQISQEIDQKIVEQRNPVLNKKSVRQTAGEIKKFQSLGLTKDELPDNLEINQEVAESEKEPTEDESE